MIGILRLMGSFVQYKGCNDKKNIPFLNTIPSFIVNFDNSSRLNIGENAYKILHAYQRSVQDPECPIMHDETFFTVQIRIWRHRDHTKQSYFSIYTQEFGV